MVKNVSTRIQNELPPIIERWSEEGGHMKFDKIHHIAIIGSDYEASRNFYVNLLGFEVI